MNPKGAEVTEHQVHLTGAQADEDRSLPSGFGHHPDPAIDFCLEVEAIEGELFDRKAGLAPTMDVGARIAGAMQFKAGGSAAAVAAKADLRKYEAGFNAALAAAPSREAAPTAFYISGPYADGNYGLCELATGRVVQLLGQDDFPQGFAPTGWDASQIKQPGWNHVQQAFIDGAREAQGNPTATDAHFCLASDGYTKRVFEELDPVSEAALRTESWMPLSSPSAVVAPPPGIDVEYVTNYIEGDYSHGCHPDPAVNALIAWLRASDLERSRPKTSPDEKKDVQ